MSFVQADLSFMSSVNRRLDLRRSSPILYCLEHTQTCLYLNHVQVKPMSIGMSAGGPDKSQSKRVELWTKNVLDYTQWLLDDLCQSGGTSGAQSQNMSSSGASVEREPDVLTKWRYVVRLAQWHYTEGLLNRTQVVDWALKQLQVQEFVNDI